MSLRHLKFTGTSYEQALSHGEALKESIENNISVYTDRFYKEAGISKQALLENTSVYYDKLKDQSPEYIKAIEGIALSSNLPLLEIAMLNLRYELLYYALGKLYQEGVIDGCTSFALLPGLVKKTHLVMGQNWDWIPEVECVLISNFDSDGLSRISFTEAGIFAGKPGMNSQGIGLAVNGMYSSADNWKRFEKPFHVRCFEVLRSSTIEQAMNVLTGTPRSCTANFIIGEYPDKIVNIELAPDTFLNFYPNQGLLTHANNFADPNNMDVSEPPNPRRHLSAFRHERMKILLSTQKILDMKMIQNTLKDHEHHPQSLCRHRDNDLPKSQQTITKTSMIMDLEDLNIWATDGQPCMAEFEKFSLA